MLQAESFVATFICVRPNCFTCVCIYKNVVNICILVHLFDKFGEFFMYTY